MTISGLLTTPEKPHRRPTRAPGEAAQRAAKKRPLGGGPQAPCLSKPRAFPGPSGAGKRERGLGRAYQATTAPTGIESRGRDHATKGPPKRPQERPRLTGPAAVNPPVSTAPGRKGGTPGARRIAAGGDQQDARPRPDPTPGGPPTQGPRRTRAGAQDCRAPCERPVRGPSNPRGGCGQGGGGGAGQAGTGSGPGWRWNRRRYHSGSGAESTGPKGPGRAPQAGPEDPHTGATTGPASLRRCQSP